MYTGLRLKGAPTAWKAITFVWVVHCVYCMCLDNYYTVCVCVCECECECKCVCLHGFHVGLKKLIRARLNWQSVSSYSSTESCGHTVLFQFKVPESTRTATGFFNSAWLCNILFNWKITNNKVSKYLNKLKEYACI